jgi:uncharacterized protein (DUF169 family)
MLNEYVGNLEDTTVELSRKNEQNCESCPKGIKSEEILNHLQLDMEPVGIYLGNTTIEEDTEVPVRPHNCVVPFINAAARGKIVSIDGKRCTCPGGAVGCCFGDGFSRLRPDMDKMLSQGYGEDADVPAFMKEGERFFCTEELAGIWRTSLPYSEKGYPRVVFAPLSRRETFGNPDLVWIYADPDQISALVILLGAHNGRAQNVIAPYCSACQSIMFAAAEAEKDDPKAVMGLFDISQRTKALSRYLTLTMPYQLWETLIKDPEKSCLTSESWKKIEERICVQRRKMK